MSRLTVYEQNKISQTEEIIVYRFSDRSHLRKALQLAGDVYGDGNKFLAMLGDNLIKVVLVNEGISRRADREKISLVVSDKASKAFLAERGFTTGLQDQVFKNPSQGNQVFTGPMASTVEAIIAAVFNDSGANFRAVEGVMKTLGITWPE